MSTAARKNGPAWQANLTWERRFIPLAEQPADDEAEPAPGPEDEATPEVCFLKVWDCFVDVFRPGNEDERVRFRVNRRKGHAPTVTDPRERFTGTTGLTGLWGTYPAPPPPPRPRSLMLLEFQAVLARMVGTERAETIVRTIRSDVFLDQSMTNVRG